METELRPPWTPAAASCRPASSGAASCRPASSGAASRSSWWMVDTWQVPGATEVGGSGELLRTSSEK